VPFTSGILIGIGETREERLDTLFAIRDSDRKHGGHIQEVIVQNFRAKEDTRRGLYKLHPVDPQLETARFQLLSL
jgi:FO synthase